MKIGIVAGEASGDILGAGLIKALKKQLPELELMGIGGPLMQAQGCESWFEMERLSVMGVVEPLGRLPELWRMRKTLIQRFINAKIDIFIGVDAPAFNTGLELALKNVGIKTVHYVSPSIWAWRKKRIHKIKRAVDLMLTLFPFENAIYDEHHVDNQFVGHPLADEIPLEVDVQEKRKLLGLPLERRIVAVLPGSRGTELRLLTQPFIEAAKRCYERDPGLFFVVPFVNEQHKKLFEEAVQHLAPRLPLQCFVGHSRDVMAASDVVLLSSGTATLEGLLLGRPMVIAYKLTFLTHLIAKCLVHLDYYSLPNLLAGREIIPEYIQADATPEQLSKQIMHYLNHPQEVLKLQSIFLEIHQKLKRNASEAAASAIMQRFKESAA